MFCYNIPYPCLNSCLRYCTYETHCKTYCNFPVLVSIANSSRQLKTASVQSIILWTGQEQVLLITEISFFQPLVDVSKVKHHVDDWKQAPFAYSDILYTDRWSLNLRHLQDMGFRMFYEHKVFRNSEVRMRLDAPHYNSERMEGIEEPPHGVLGEHLSFS